MQEGLGFPSYGVLLRRGTAGCVAVSFPIPELVASLSWEEKGISMGEFFPATSWLGGGSLRVASLERVAPIGSLKAGTIGSTSFFPTFRCVS